MNKQRSIAVLVGVSVVFLWACAAGVTAEEAAAPQPTGAPVVDHAAKVAKLVTAMDRGDSEAGKELGELCRKNAGKPDQRVICMSLIGALSGSHKVETRVQICNLLGQFAGEKEVVAALDKALDDAGIAKAARASLVRIPDMSATVALLARLKKGDEASRIATINALGEKADASTVSALAEETAASSEEVRKAAWHALAQIPNSKAVEPFITAAGEKKDAVAIGELLDFVDVLLRAGMLADADKLLKLREEAGSLNTQDRCKVLRAHGRLGTPESISLVLAALEDKDPAIRKAALEAAAILPSTDFTNELTRKMNAATGQAKLDLLEVLGKRGKQFDDRTVMIMYMAMLDKDDNVRIACIKAMKNAGITATSPTLINMVRGKPGPVADAAEDSLIHLPGGAITQQIADALAASKPEAKVRLLQILQKRGDKAATSAVLSIADDPDVNVRAAAYETLGVLGGENAYDLLMAAFDRGPGPDRDAAEKAMMKLTSDNITAKLLSGYFESSDEQKPSILRVLAPRQLTAIDALLQSEASSTNERIREAAESGLALRKKASRDKVAPAEKSK